MAKKKQTKHAEIPTKQGKSQVGYKPPPKEHQFQPGQSGNPAGPPVHRTQLWVWFCKYRNMTDTELEELDRDKLTQAKKAALKVVENMKDGKAGSQRLALSVFDREEGKALQTQVVEDKREPLTRAELEDALAELHELKAQADVIQMQVNQRCG